MRRYEDVVINGVTGQPVANALVTVYFPSTTNKATIYSDDGVTQQGNPLTTDGLGRFAFYVADGRYDFAVSGTNIVPYTQANIEIADVSEAGPGTGDVTWATLGLTSPMTGGSNSAPMRIGPDWYPGTASGTCSPPSAQPAAGIDSIIAGNIPVGTYYFKTTYFNLHGETTPSPTPGSGLTISGSPSAFALKVQPQDQNAYTGCYGMRVYISSTGANGTYYRATAATLPVANVSSWSCDANKFCTVITSAAHNFVPGEQVTFAGTTVGGSGTNINSAFILTAGQLSSPTTLFFRRQFGGADSAGAGGTGTVVAGLGSDQQGHYAWIGSQMLIAAIPNSGPQPPSSNTATIDPLQVALNSVNTYSSLNGVAINGRLIIPQGTITLTTPLIVGNHASLQGRAMFAQDGAFTGTSVLTNSFTPDINLATVMVAGPNTSTAIQDVEIDSAGHALMITDMGSTGGSNHLYRNLSLRSTSTTSHAYCGLAIHGGVWYDMHFENLRHNSADLANVCADSVSGANWYFSGSRWDSGVNHFLSHSSVTDPDHAQNLGAFPNAVASVEFRNILTEGGSGIPFEMTNMGMRAYNLYTADPSPAANTPAIVRVGCDANAGTGNFGAGNVLRNVYLQPGGNYNSMIQYIGNASCVGMSLLLDTVVGGQTNAIDMNNINIPLFAESSSVNPDETAAGLKIINQPANPNILFIQSAVDNGGTQANMRLGGPIQFGLGNQQITTGKTFYLCYPGGAGNRLGWYGGPCGTGSNAIMEFSANRTRWWDNSGSFSNALLDVNASSGANQINLGNPTSPTNSMVNLGYAMKLLSSTFASLPGSPNGSILYCSDCTIANPCASGGNGALAKRLNGAWVCN